MRLQCSNQHKWTAPEFDLNRLKTGGAQGPSISLNVQTSFLHFHKKTKPSRYECWYIRSHHVRKSQVHVEEEFVSKLIYVFAQVCVHACLTAQKTARQKHLVRFHGCTLPSHVWLNFESGWGIKKKRAKKNQTNTIYGKEWTVWEIACMQRSEETYDN